MFSKSKYNKSKQYEIKLYVTLIPLCDHGRDP